jgi:hypothetical protein
MTDVNYLSIVDLPMSIVNLPMSIVNLLMVTPNNRDFPAEQFVDASDSSLDKNQCL